MRRSLHRWPQHRGGICVARRRGRSRRPEDCLSSADQQQAPHRHCRLRPSLSAEGLGATELGQLRGGWPRHRQAWSGSTRRRPDGSAFDALRTDMAAHEGFAAKKWIFKGHRALFAAKSTFFREALFESRTLMEASGLRKLELPNVSPRAFELIRHYVYTGRCTLSVDTVLELTAACCACELESLLIDCVNYALASLSVDNVCDMLITADVNEDDLHGGAAEAPQLKERCVEFICEHAQQVLETEGFLYLPDHLVAMLVQRDDLAAPEIDIFQAVSRWVHADQASRTSVAHDITQHLRLPLLSFRQIMKDVKPTGLVAMEQWLEALDYLSAADDPTFTKKTVSEHNAWMFTPRRAPVRDDSVRWSQASTALTVKNDGSTVQSWTSGWHGVLGEQVMTAGGVHTFSVRIDTKNNVGNDWEAIIGVASATSGVKQGDAAWCSVAGYIIGTGGKSAFGDGAGMAFATPAARQCPL